MHSPVATYPMAVAASAGAEYVCFSVEAMRGCHVCKDVYSKKALLVESSRVEMSKLTLRMCSQ